MGHCGSPHTLGDSTNYMVHDLRSILRGSVPWIILVLLGLGPLLVCALIGPPEVGSDLGQKAAPDWSRAMRVGSEFYGTDSGAPLSVDADGRVHLVWTLRLNAHEYDIRYVRLDDLGLVEEEHDLHLPLFQPRKVRLVQGSDSLMHVFLLAYSEQAASSGLYHFALSGQGQVVEGPSLLSSATDDCFEYDVAKSSSGTMHLLWTEGVGSQRDLYYLELGAGAQTSTAPRLIKRGVSSPVVATGPDDALHLFWEEPGPDEDTAELHHTVVGTVPDSVTGPKLLDLPTGRRFFRTGPVVAFDQEYAYLVWTVEYRRDIGAPAMSEGWYGSLALGSPSSVSARSFYLPMDERPTYVPYDSPLRYDYLVPSQGTAEFGSERVTSPSALSGHREALVTCGMTVRRGASYEHQIVNLIFGGGGLQGYQVAGSTTHWSRLPNVVADGDGDLYLSWVDGLEPGPSDVFFATTVQRVRERVDGLTGGDLLSATLNTAFSAVTGVAAIPLVLSWALSPVIWAVVAGHFIGGSGVRSAKGYAALAVGVIIYQVSKLYFSPSLLDYVPFSASVPFLPEGLYYPLQALIPVGIAGLAALGTVFAFVRAQTSNLLVFSLVFILIDASLTVMVYGPGLAALA
jgi:hypothetical protein